MAALGSLPRATALEPAREAARSDVLSGERITDGGPLQARDTDQTTILITMDTTIRATTLITILKTQPAKNLRRRSEHRLPRQHHR
jgi:hypothetical protein